MLTARYVASSAGTVVSHRASPLSPVDCRSMVPIMSRSSVSFSLFAPTEILDVIVGMSLRLSFRTVHRIFRRWQLSIGCAVCRFVGRWVGARWTVPYLIGWSEGVARWVDTLHGGYRDCRSPAGTRAQFLSAGRRGKVFVVVVGRWG